MCRGAARTGCSILVNAILDLSHLESGQVPIKRQYISLKDLVLDTLLLQVPQAQEKELILVDDLPSNCPRCGWMRVSCGAYFKLDRNAVNLRSRVAQFG